MSTEPGTAHAEVECKLLVPSRVFTEAVRNDDRTACDLDRSPGAHREPETISQSDLTFVRSNGHGWNTSSGHTRFDRNGGRYQTIAPAEIPVLNAPRARIACCNPGA